MALIIPQIPQRPLNVGDRFNPRYGEDNLPLAFKPDLGEQAILPKEPTTILPKEPTTIFEDPDFQNLNMKDKFMVFGEVEPEFKNLSRAGKAELMAKLLYPEPKEPSYPQVIGKSIQQGVASKLQNIADLDRRLMGEPQPQEMKAGTVGERLSNLGHPAEELANIIKPEVPLNFNDLSFWKKAVSGATQMGVSLPEYLIASGISKQAVEQSLPIITSIGERVAKIVGVKGVDFIRKAAENIGTFGLGEKFSGGDGTHGAVMGIPFTVATLPGSRLMRTLLTGAIGYEGTAMSKGTQEDQLINGMLMSVFGAMSDPIKKTLLTEIKANPQATIGELPSIKAYLQLEYKTGADFGIKEPVTPPTDISPQPAYRRAGVVPEKIAMEKYTTPEIKQIPPDLPPDFSRLLKEDIRRSKVTESDIIKRRQEREPFKAEPTKELTQSEQMIKNLTIENELLSRGLDKQNKFFDEKQSEVSYPFREYQETNIPIINEQSATPVKPIAESGLKADLELALNKEPAMRTQFERVIVGDYNTKNATAFSKEFTPSLWGETIDPKLRAQVLNEIKRDVEARKPRQDLQAKYEAIEGELAKQERIRQGAYPVAQEQLRSQYKKGGDAEYVTPDIQSIKMKPFEEPKGFEGQPVETELTPIEKAGQHGEVIGIDAKTKLPIIDTSIASKPKAPIDKSVENEARQGEIQQTQAGEGKPKEAWEMTKEEYRKTLSDEELHAGNEAINKYVSTKGGNVQELVDFYKKKYGIKKPIKVLGQRWKNSVNKKGITITREVPHIYADKNGYTLRISPDAKPVVIRHEIEHILDIERGYIPPDAEYGGGFASKGMKVSIEKHFNFYDNYKKFAADYFHHSQVKKALSEGKKVPDEVLKDYPDLQKSHPPSVGRVEGLSEKASPLKSEKGEASGETTEMYAGLPISKELIEKLKNPAEWFKGLKDYRAFVKDKDFAEHISKDFRSKFNQEFIYPRTLAGKFPDTFKPIYEKINNYLRQVDLNISKYVEIIKPYYDLNDKSLVDQLLVKSRMNDKIYTDIEASKMGLKEKEITAYKSVLDTTKQALNNLESELMKAGNDPKEVKQYISQLPKAYVPLSRFGDYFVSIKDAQEKPVKVTFHDSKREMAAEVMKARKTPNVTVNYGEVGKLAESAYHGMPLSVLSILKQFDNELGTKLSAEYSKIIGKGFPQHLIHAEQIKGFETDLSKPIADYILSMSRYTAGKGARQDLADLLTKIDPKKQHGLYDYSTRYIDDVMNGKSSFNKMRKFLFHYYLGGNIKSALLNLTQPITVTYPVLSKYTKKSLHELTKGFSQANKYLFGGKIDPELEQAIKIMIEDGSISAQMVDFIKGERYGKGLTGGMISKILSAFFGNAEKYNRLVTVITGFNIAKGKGMNFNDAVKFAENLNEETQFNYSMGNRPQIARGKLAPLFVFRQFTGNYLSLMKNSLKEGEYETVAKMLGVMVAMGGTMAIPGIKELEKTLEMAGYDPKKIVKDTIGKYGDLALHGGLFPLGVDISGSLGTMEFLPEDIKNLSEMKGDIKKVVGAVGITLAGVPADLPSRVFRAYNILKTQRDPYRAVETLMPEMIRNPMVAYRWATDAEGIARTPQGKPIYKPSTKDIALKTMAIQPSKLSKTYEREHSEQLLKGKVTEAKDMSENYHNLMAKAVIKGDAKGYQKLLQEVLTYNTENPKEQIILSQEGFRNQFIKMKYPEMGELKSLPKWARPEYMDIQRSYNNTEGE